MATLFIKSYSKTYEIKLKLDVTIDKNRPGILIYTYIPIYDISIPWRNPKDWSDLDHPTELEWIYNIEPTIQVSPVLECEIIDLSRCGLKDTRYEGKDKIIPTHVPCLHVLKSEEFIREIPSWLIWSKSETYKITTYDPTKIDIILDIGTIVFNYKRKTGTISVLSFVTYGRKI